MSRSALFVLLAAAALLVLWPGDAAAQCGMCRTALEQNPEAAAGFNRAILFLLVMPYAVFASLAGYVLVSRRRKAVQGAAVGTAAAVLAFCRRKARLGTPVFRPAPRS